MEFNEHRYFSSFYSLVQTKAIKTLFMFMDSQKHIMWEMEETLYVFMTCLIVQMRGISPKRLNVFSTLYPLVLSLNDFINGLRDGNRQICEDHKGSLLLQPLDSVFTLLDFLPARFTRYSVLSSLPPISWSKLWSQTFMLAVYLFPLLPSPESFLLTNCKLWNFEVKNWH